ncbi:S-layer protein, partial [Thermococci archaeon]
MKIKKIGAILAGAVMIGSAVAAAWDPSEDTDFFINSETGEPNSIIVVGANAAASDVTAAGWIA